MTSASPTLTVPPIDAPPSPFKLVVFPSFTAASAEAVRKALHDNHQRYHIFFNEGGFHKHFVHRALSALALGLPPVALERGYFDLWKLTSADLRDPTAQEPGWMAKWEELVWFSSALVIGSTVKPGKKMTHDFSLVHLNSAALFMPVLLPLLSERSKSDLLHAYFRICITIWLGVGRPSFHVGATLMASSDTPRNPNTGSATPTDYGKQASVQEPPAWYDLVAAASVHGDAHHVKAIRALMCFNHHFAHRPAGFASVQRDLVAKEMEKLDALRGKPIRSVFDGLERLDGTAFLRTAGQLMQSQGWKTESLGLKW